MLAEKTGAIVDIGRWVLGRACQDATRWADELTVTVNLSLLQFENGDLIGVVKQALAEAGLAASRLELEISEALLERDKGKMRCTLESLRQLGVGITLDNFGKATGSLSSLRSFPFDKVKIDDAMVSIDDLEKVLRKHGGDITGHKVVRHKTAEPSRHVPGNYYRDWDHIEISYNPIPPDPDNIVEHLEKVRRRIRGHGSLGDIDMDQRWALRLELLQLRRALNEFEEIYAPFLTEEEHGLITEASHDILAMTEYSPRWVLLGIVMMDQRREPQPTAVV